MAPKDAEGHSAPSGSGDDLFNSLPDDILIRVLCHLKAWDAVRMSVVSKRWCDLWASMPCLDIRQPSGGQRRARKFADFVRHLLLRRLPLKEPPLEAFRVSWSHMSDDFDGDADTWIADAVTHGAVEVELSASGHVWFPVPNFLSFVPEDTPVRLKIVKLIHVLLDDFALRQLSSRLEELELKDSLVEGREIRSTSLKSLTLINCNFDVDDSDFMVHTPNLVLLRCDTPYGYIPSIQSPGHLVSVTILLDDLCLGKAGTRQWKEKSKWEEKKHPKDECDFFGHAEDPDYNSFENSGASAEESGHNFHNESDHDDDSSKYYDPDWSGPSDDEWDDRVVCYSFIADEQRKKPYKYLIHGNKRSAAGARDDFGGNSNFGGNGMLCGLSNVERMDLLAHSGETVLRRELKSCPRFKNLKTLSLGEWCMTPQLDGLAYILNRSPNLENLFLHLDLTFDTRMGIDPQGRSFSCPNLQRVMIKSCNRDVMVHKLAEFFRENGIPNKKIFVCRTASSSSGSAKVDAGSPFKRKAESEAESRYAKQSKPGN